MRSIETEHLLLGLIREPRGHAGKLLLTLPLDEIRLELDTRTGEKIPTSVEIPFSAETKRVLDHACNEADQLNHRHIGPEHLLLGLLRENQCRAASTLERYGLSVESARSQIRELSIGAAPTRVSPSAVQAQLKQIMESTRQLMMSLSGDDGAQLQAHLLLQELQLLKSLLDERE